MEQEIADTLQLLGSGSTKVRHRILTSVRFHRENRYFFSERTFRFPLVVGRSEYRPGDGYGLPGDLVEIIGDTIWLIQATNPDQRVPVARVGREDMDWDRALEVNTTGEPSLWDWWENALRLSPAPADAQDLTGPYVRDLGVPLKRYNTTTSQWEFLTPDGGATLSGDFSNHWFDQLGGYEMVKQRALHLIYKEILQNEEMANSHLVSWLEEKGRLEDETEGKSSPMEIVPTLW